MADVFNADLYLENLEKELFGKEEDVKESASNEFIMSCLEFAMNFDDYSDEELFTEGFNNDLKKQYRDDMKEIKKIMRSIKRDMRDDSSIDSLKVAVVNFEKLEDKIDKMIEDIKSKKGDKPATLVGVLYRQFIGSMKMFAAFIVTLPLGGAGSIVSLIEQSITDSFGLYSKLMDKVKSGEELSIDDFNTYKNSLISKLKLFKDKVTKEKESVKDHIFFVTKSKEEVAKEKANDIFEKEKLKLYEACSTGLITEDQREELLSRFKNMSKVEESVISNNINDDFSNRDKFDAVKKDIYERCAKGEFTIDVREDLIKEAYSRFFEGDDVDKIIDDAKKKSTLNQDGNKLINDVNKVTQQ